MKVSGSGDIKNEVILKYQQAGAAKTGVEKAEVGKGLPGDRISISSQTQDINLAKGVIDNLPEVRDDVVQEIKKSVDNGTYQVNLDKLAEKMLTESILDIYA
jgi:negative regulator of flagellin synthesis FlgM